MTDRDAKVVEFVEKCSCYSDTIQKLFYPSQRVANRRLAWLHDQLYLRRTRDTAAEKYFYFTKNRNKQREHFDTIARTYLWLMNNGYKIHSFEVQKQYGKIRPDMVLDLEREKRVILAVEVELSNNDIQSKIKKYEESMFKKLLLVSSASRSSKEIDIINLNIKELT